MQNFDSLPDSLSEIFHSVFGRSPDIRCFAPGRVNLIGEHTDYNGGHVFPCAIHLGIECAAARRSDDLLRFYSVNFPDAGVIECRVDELTKAGSWADYPKGVIQAFRQSGYMSDGGAEFAFRGNLPDGAGLSSSAALEVLTGTVLRELYGFDVTPQRIALLGQSAEHDFIGVNCGIMDQFASAMGKRNHAILLDSGTLDYEYAPIDGEKACIVIMNSGVKHSLASSAYNERRRQCEQAFAALSVGREIPSLCALTPQEFDQMQSSIADIDCRRRARHAIYENARTIQAADALRRGDLVTFGNLMNESHLSLRDDYEVSCRELDVLAEEAWHMEGVYGARMTGGGFGGCTVNLVRRDAVEDFIPRLKERYRLHCHLEAQAYVVDISDGAGRIED